MFTRKFVGVVIGLLLIFCVLTANAFDHVRFAVISDPHVSLPAKGVVDGFKLGDKKNCNSLLQAAVDEINSVPDLDFRISSR